MWNDGSAESPKTFTTKAMVVGYYLIGAFTTAAVIRLMEKIQSQ